MKPTRIVLLAAAVALLLKWLWASFSIGTNDTMFFGLFGEAIAKHGLVSMYSDKLFNHTPFVGTYLGAIYVLSQGDFHRFAFLLRAPGILADFGAVLALLWVHQRTGRPPLWALVVFALSPVSLMVSGYHGNVDSILAFALTLTACACVARSPLGCGLALAFALQIKVVALLVAPALLAWWWQQGKAREFFLTTALVAIAGWIVPLVAVPEKFIGNVLTYPSYFGSWGVTMWLRLTGFEAFQKVGFIGLSPAQQIAGTILKVVIIGAAFALAWRRRKCEPVGVFETIGLTWLVFFTFAPGFGPQYLVWLMPFVLMISARWYVLLTLFSSIFLYRFYDVISKGWPWHHGVSTNALEPHWMWWTLLPWLVIAAWTAVALRNEFRSAAEEVTAEPQLMS